MACVKKCRLCLSEEGNMEPLFEVANDDLPTKIWQCTSVKVQDYAGLPGCICDVCKSELIIWMKFRRMCLKNNDILMESFRKYFGSPLDFNAYLFSKCIVNFKETVTHKMLNPQKTEYRIDNKVISGAGSEEESKFEQTAHTLQNCEDQSVSSIGSENEERTIQMEIETNPRTEENDDSYLKLQIGTINCKSTSSGNQDTTKIQKTILRNNRVRNAVKCSICGKYQQNLKQHMRIHFDEKPFKCPFCDRSFRQSGNYSRHMNIHTGRKPYKCTECDTAFADPASLRAHNVRHTGMRLYKCNVCEKSFGHSHVLAAHKRIHTQDRRHSCSFCEKRFLSNHALKKHIRTHTGEKPYKCQLCSKTFATSGNLLTHQKVHTKEKPFKCTICSNTFAYRCVLKIHMRKHFNDSQQVKRSENCLITTTEGTKLIAINIAHSEIDEHEDDIYEIIMETDSTENT